MQELSPFLQPIGSPITSDDSINAQDFDSSNERGAVTGIFIQDLAVGNAKIGTAAIGTANIGTLTFNEISGGTATLGGTANGDGVLSINDAAGSETVRGDKDGLTVKTTAGTTLIDGSGFISSSLIDATHVTSNPEQGFTGTAWTDVNSSLSTISLTRTTNVLIMMNTDIWFSFTGGDAIATGKCGFSIDDEDPLNSARKRGQQITAGTTIINPGAHISTHSTHRVRTLGSADHTIRLKAQITDKSGVGTAQFNVANFGYSFIILGPTV